jgi:hypothetical protein
MALSIATINPLATLAAILFLPVAIKLLYRKNEPPILCIAILLQWLQVTIKIFFADIYRLDFPTGFEYPGHVQQAYYSSLFGLLVMSVGIFLTLRRTPVFETNRLREIVQRYSIKRITLLYLAAVIISPILLKFGSLAGGVQQFVVKIVDLKWSLLFIFYMIVFLKQEGKKTFYIIILGEIILSLTGYFSSFKDYFLVLALGFLMLHQQLKFKQVLVMVIAGTILFNLFVVWTYIKPEYRAYLTGGRFSQQVQVQNGDALNRLTQLAFKMDTASYRKGTRMLLERISYIDYYSASIGYVPGSVPYEKGKLWWGATTNIFMPRLLFPDKPVLDDSKRLNKYTGLSMYGAEKGVSISLGYMAESYVDFGSWLMFIPVFLFGILVGSMFKYIVRSVLWGYAFLMPLFFNLNVFEVALDKLVGGTLSFFIVLWILNKCKLPYFLDRFLINKNEK